MSEQQEQTEASDGQSELTDVLGTDPYEAEERYLRDTLAMLQESYTKAAKPYLDRLVAIHSIKPMRMMVTVAEAEAMGFKVPNA